MGLTFAMKFLGIGRTILSAIRSGARWCLSDWRHAVIAALVAVAAYFYLSAGKWQGRAEKALATVEKRDKTIADMKAASKKARQEQIALNQAVEARYRVNQEKTDARYQIALDAARGASVRYIDRWRVRVESSADSPNSTAESNPTESGNGAGQSADMVAISLADFDVCTVNSVRIAEVHAWGQGLIKDGVAE